MVNLAAMATALAHRPGKTGQLSRRRRDNCFARETSAAIRVVLDPDHTIETAFQVRWKPTVYVIEPDQKVALRTISNTLTDLEDMLDGIAHAQGGAAMLPSEGEEGVAMSGEEV